MIDIEIDFVATRNNAISIVPGPDVKIPQLIDVESLIKRIMDQHYIN